MEAFVSGAAKGVTHEEDAKAGIEAFCAQLPTPGDSNARETERPFSLAASAAAWAGFDVAAQDPPAVRPCARVSRAVSVC